MPQITIETIIYFIGRALALCTALPVHECAHGLAAYKLGDDTARLKGRLTLNPFAHLDPVGTVLMFLAGLGWAKPVPVDPRNFKHPKRDMALTALAGPVSNVLLAFLLMIIYKLMLGFMPGLRTSQTLAYLSDIVYYMVYINILLAVFNFLPVPPLDGSRIVFSVLPDRLYFGVMRYERIISLIVFALIFSRLLTVPLQWATGYVIDFLDLVTYPVDLLFS